VVLEHAVVHTAAADTLSDRKRKCSGLARTAALCCQPRSLKYLVKVCSEFVFIVNVALKLLITALYAEPWLRGHYRD
jgi:hypothetical protein